MGRAPCCDKANVKRGPWSPEEDAILKAFIDQHGTGGNWITLPLKAGLKRCGKSCRLRWINYLRPGIKRGGFTDEEEALIYKLHGNFGSRWSLIAAQLPGRTDNDIKNYWNTRMKRKLSIKSTEYPNMQLAVNLIPFRNEAGKYDQPAVISPIKAFPMSNALACSQLPVEEMLQRIENSLQSCISTNSLESSCSRTSTERTNNAAQSTIRNSFSPLSIENDRIASVEEAYQYVLPALPCGMEEFFPKPLDSTEKSQPPLYQITEKPINRQLHSLGIDDSVRQSLAAQFVNKNFNVMIDELNVNVDTSRQNPLLSAMELPAMWKGSAWTPRFY